MIISADVLVKLRDKHNVTAREVEQCFENLCGIYLEDNREEHQIDPATLWFISPTNKNKLLKIIFIFSNGNIHIKSAYEPSISVVSIYDRFGK